jgi:hypothetical protein
MRTFWLIGFALGLFGCTSTDNQISRPPTAKHEYILPPSDDPRFAQPPAFPEKTLMNQQPRNPNADSGGPMMGPGGSGGRGGMPGSTPGGRGGAM